MERNEVLSRREVMAYLGISDKTMYRWIKANRLPAAIQLSPRLIFWSKFDIEAFKERGCR